MTLLDQIATALHPDLFHENEQVRLHAACGVPVDIAQAMIKNSAALALGAIRELPPTFGDLSLRQVLGGPAILSQTYENDFRESWRRVIDLELTLAGVPVEQI